MTPVAIDKNGNPMPTTYVELARRWTPRTIHSQEEADRAWKAIERLVLGDLTADQQDYLDLVSDLIHAYEQKRFAHLNRKLSVAEFLKIILEETGMSASDLGRLLGERSIVSAVMTGRRKLSKNHIRILCEQFKLDPMAFLQEPDAKPSRPLRARRPRLRTGRSNAKAVRP